MPTPGRRRISPSGVRRAPSTGARRARRAITCGSGRTQRTSTSATIMKPPAASHGTTSSCASRCCPAKSGLNTNGPSTAPATAPKRTSEICRGRRSGGTMSAAAARASRTVPFDDADEREAEDDERRRVPEAAERGDRGADDAGQAPDGKHGDAAVTVHQPAGRERGERGRGEEDRRPEAEDALDPGDDDERGRRNRDDELDRPGEADQRPRRAGACSAGPGTSVTRAIYRGRPGTPAAPPCEGWRTYGAPVTCCASRPTAIRRRPRATPSRKGEEASTSARVGRRFVYGRSGSCGCVGTTFQSRTSSSSPSSASTRWTIVALASAGPEPVSCRSEVNGIPQTRAPR